MSCCPYLLRTQKRVAGCRRGQGYYWAGRWCHVRARKVPCLCQHLLCPAAHSTVVRSGSAGSTWASSPCRNGHVARASSRDHDIVVAQSKIDEVFTSLVSYDAMTAVLDDQQVYQRRRRLLQAKPRQMPQRWAWTTTLALWIAAISTRSSARPPVAIGITQRRPVAWQTLEAFDNFIFCWILDFKVIGLDFLPFKFYTDSNFSYLDIPWIPFIWMWIETANMLS